MDDPTPDLGSPRNQLAFELHVGEELPDVLRPQIFQVSFWGVLDEAVERLAVLGEGIGPVLRPGVVEVLLDHLLKRLPAGADLGSIVVDRHPLATQGMDGGLGLVGGDRLVTVAANSLLDPFAALPPLDVEGAFGDLGGGAVDEHLIGKVAVVLPGDGDEGPGTVEFNLALEVDGGGSASRLHLSPWCPNPIGYQVKG
jgi:hypothetical protein